MQLKIAKNKFFWNNYNKPMYISVNDNVQAV